MVEVDTRSLRALIAAGKRLLAQARGELAPLRTRGGVEALVRYRGQGACLSVPLSSQLPSAFAAEHQRRFGFVADAPLEVVQLRARCEAPAKALPRSDRTPGAGSSWSRRAPLGNRRVAVHHRGTLDAPVPGPAVVEEATATTLVPAGCTARPAPFGLLLQRNEDL